LAESAGHLGHGDHACLLHSSETGRHSAALRFVRRGLGEGQKVVYVAGERRRDAVACSLAASGPDLAGAIAAGRLDVRPPNEAYLEGRGFDAGRTIERLRDEIASAPGEGFSGMRIAAEMDWVPSSGTDPRSLIDYESRVEELLRQTGTAALCQYDRRSFDLETTREAERVHHLVLAERDAQGGAPCELLIERGPSGETVLRGEADGRSAESLARSLAVTIARSDDVRLDLRDLSYVGAAGLRAIRDAGEALAARGGRLTLVSPRPVVTQVVTLMGLTESIAVEGL
jgi:anti-anti-sigma factor